MTSVFMAYSLLVARVASFAPSLGSGANDAVSPTDLSETLRKFFAEVKTEKGQPGHFPFGPQKGAFYRGQFVIWPCVVIIMAFHG